MSRHGHAWRSGVVKYGVWWHPQLTSMILEGLGVSHMAITSARVQLYTDNGVEVPLQVRTACVSQYDPCKPCCLHKTLP